MLRAISAELQKWRRTWFVLVTVAASLVTPVLLCIAFLLSDRQATWDQLFGQATMFEMLFIGPLVVTLIGAQSISTEYQYDTWKLSLTSPIPRWKIYMAKWIVGLVWNLALGVIVLGGNLLVGFLLGATGPLNLGVYVTYFLLAGVGLTVMLPVYHFITLVTRSFFVTSGVGIVSTFVGLFIINSKYAAIYPHSGMAIMLSAMTGDKIHPEMIGSWPVWIAIQVGVFLAALLGSTLFVHKADYR
ncbi:MAG TPA: ABC transporter permease [Symbiobacteriaceae bacterium]|nr:ABC transporter permease [Symbiobacteriaceae bacterium]